MKKISFESCRVVDELWYQRWLCKRIKRREKKIYREDILIGIGEFIKLEHINWRQLFNVIDKDQYIGEFLGCSNMVYRITEEQERRLIELNNQKAREKENVQKKKLKRQLTCKQS